MISQAIVRCAEEISRSGRKSWVIGYSGGKDSTAALKVFLHAARLAGAQDHLLTIIYCDTGVENPVLDLFAKRSLADLRDELPNEFPNAKVEILRAPINERFFVRVIGRGYAPPSNRFRWCTKGLRVLPVERFISSKSEDVAVVLGLRYGESHQRDRSLRADGGDEFLWQRQREGSRRDLFLPVIDFGLEDVWGAAQSLPYPRAIDSFGLEELYRGASDECPMIRSPLAPPCASGRFGCWTCTVVRKDKSSANLIRQGREWLKPYVEFRDWLQTFRTRSDLRWPMRRNGAMGPGPFTVVGRRKILRELELLEVEVGRELVSHEELHRIRALWDLDQDTEHRLGLTA